MTAALGLLAAALMTVSLTGLLLLAASESMIARNHLASTQALALAESGLEVALVQLNRGASVGALHVHLGEGDYSIAAHMIDGEHILVTASGHVGGSTRTVSNVLARDAAGLWAPGRDFREDP